MRSSTYSLIVVHIFTLAPLERVLRTRRSERWHFHEFAIFSRGGNWICRETEERSVSAACAGAAKTADADTAKRARSLCLPNFTIRKRRREERERVRWDWTSGWKNQNWKCNSVLRCRKFEGRTQGAQLRGRAAKGTRPRPIPSLRAAQISCFTLTPSPSLRARDD